MPMVGIPLTWKPWMMPYKAQKLEKTTFLSRKNGLCKHNGPAYQ